MNLICLYYKILKTYCITRLIAAIAIQQEKPINIGFEPVFTSLTMFVFKPIAAIAIIMKNLLNSLVLSVNIGDKSKT
ncbi:MAG: hypothetical protein WC234_04845, partial [Endomicrobiaceae bacterium]